MSFMLGRRLPGMEDHNIPLVYCGTEALGRGRSQCGVEDEDRRFAGGIY